MSVQLRKGGLGVGKEDGSRVLNSAEWSPQGDVLPCHGKEPDMHVEIDSPGLKGSVEARVTDSVCLFLLTLPLSSSDC